MKIQITPKITEILTKELSYAEFASGLLKEEMRPFEKKYKMTGKEFFDKFEKGELGDDRIWFDWYSLVVSIQDWDDTKKELKKVIRAT